MLRGAVALSALLFAAEACAQVSGSFTLVSDYRFRGVSLSDSRPAAQLSIAYDHADGWYTGVYASSVRLARWSGVDVQLLPYLGYARRVRPGLSWELGAEYAMFSGGLGYDYPEFYVGLASDHLNGRIYYASRYFDDDSPFVYAELNGARELSKHLRLLGHVGRSWRNGSSRAGDGPGQHRFDARAGIGLTLEAFELQLAWVTTDGRGRRRSIDRRPDRNAWLFSVSRAW